MRRLPGRQFAPQRRDHAGRGIGPDAGVHRSLLPDLQTNLCRDDAGKGQCDRPMKPRDSACLIHLLAASVVAMPVLLSAVHGTWATRSFRRAVAFAADRPGRSARARKQVTFDKRRLDGAIPDLIVEFPALVVIPAIVLCRCTCGSRSFQRPAGASSAIVHRRPRQFDQFSRSPVSTSNRWTRSGSGDRQIG